VLCCQGFPSSTAQILRGFVTIRFFARREIVESDG
jgi:hypothetical protein